MDLKRSSSWWHKTGISISEPPILSLESLYPLLLLALLSMLAFTFHFIRIQFSEAVDFSLDWNLLLSWIPLLIAFFTKTLTRRFGALPITVGVLSIGWVAFFPNAPYMITDLVHLSVDYDRDRTWHDTIMLFYYAQISLFNGLVSLYWFHGAWNRTYSKRTGSILLFLSFPLGGLGVFLGRILRLNSWDLFHKPGKFFANILENLNDRTALLLIVEFGLLLGTLYFVLWGLLRFRIRKQKST